MKGYTQFRGTPLVVYFPVFDESTQEILLTPNTLADTLLVVPVVYKPLSSGHVYLLEAFIVYYHEMPGVVMEEAKTNQDELKKTKKDEDKKKRKKFVDISK